MNNIISLADVKQALRDDRFRKSLPESFSNDIKKFINNPGCGCNIHLYKKILKEARDNLKEYFPDKIIEDIEESIKKEAQNNFYVINCTIQELEKKLQSLKPGRKQLAIARYEDQVTLVINDLDYIF